MTERERDRIVDSFGSMEPDVREQVLAEVMFKHDVNMDNVGDIVAEKIGESVAREIEPTNGGNG